MKKFWLSLALLFSMQQVHADPFMSCIWGTEDDLRLRSLSDKILLMNTDPSQVAHMISNTRKPTLNEQKIISAWAEARVSCEKNNPASSTEIGQIMFKGSNAVQLLILQLGGGFITYGYFAQQRQNIDSMVEAKIHEESRKTMESLQQQQIQQQTQIQQQQQAQQQQSELNRQRLEYCESTYQRCLDRAAYLQDVTARNLEQSSCGMARAGCQIAGALVK